MRRDTVCSVGLIPRRLPFVSSNTAIRYFRHAVSLDERRAKFRANLYNRATEREAALGVQPGEMPEPQAQTAAEAKAETLTAKMYDIYNTVSKSYGKKRKTHEESDLDDVKHAHDDDDGESGPQETDVVEVWFSGCHCGTFALQHRQLYDD